jgi:hyperosmotically inducible periplasmic protein
MAVTVLSAFVVATPFAAQAQTAKSTTETATAAISDSWITAKTKIALFADERVKGTQVSVDSKNGVVHLRGKVDSGEAKAAAAEIATGIESAKTVKNELQVVSPTARKAVDANDKDIAKAVEARMSKDANLKKLDVRSDGGVVTLTGEVPSIMVAAKASEQARMVPGVKSVKNELTVRQASK